MENSRLVVELAQNTDAGMPPYQDAGAGMLTTKRRTTAAQKEKKRVVKNNLDRLPKIRFNRADNEPVRMRLFLFVNAAFSKSVGYYFTLTLSQ